MSIAVPKTAGFSSKSDISFFGFWFDFTLFAQTCLG